jgi:serine/threonine protein kinase
MSDVQPKRFGKYILLEQIAVGGMAKLYSAKITGVEGFEKLIAIKTILPHFAEEKELVSSFIDEAKLAALLNHQNIVQIYDFGAMENSYYISMEYLFGKDLRIIANKSKEKGGQFSLGDALYIISRICSGLEYAHTLKDFQGKPLNIIHRDISPQNVIITYEGDVKIVDFGIAKAASQSSVTQHGMIKGKVSYMSPEQAAGKSIDHRSDIFSTGILLYELITGRRMFTGESTMQILAKVREVQFAPAEEYISDLPQKLSWILKKALAKEPANRYQSCGEMFADLEECLVELSLRSSTTGLSQYMKSLFEEEIAAEHEHFREFSMSDNKFKEEPARVAQPAPEVREAAVIDERKEALEKPRRHLYLYAGIVAALIVIVLGFVFWPGEKHIPTTETPVREDSAALEEDTEERVRELLDQASQLMETQASRLMETEPEKAKAMLIDAIKLDPGNVLNHSQLGHVYVKLKDFPKAIEAYQKVSEIDPQSPEAYFNMGYVYAIMKNYTSAEKMYSRVVDMSPSYLDEALFNLAIVQDKLGKREQGIENLEKAVRVNPDNEKAKDRLDKLKGKQIKE